METLEACRICRLCGKHSEISIHIFDKKAAVIDKIHAILPISVHEMDLLPKQMCHRCSYKLEEYHKFYIQCIKTDENLKSQLSWMKKKDKTDKIIAPMVHIGNFKIKTEPIDVDSLESHVLKPGIPFFNRYPINSNGCSPFENESFYRCYYNRQDCMKQNLEKSPTDVLIQQNQALVSNTPDNSRIRIVREAAIKENKGNSEKSKSVQVAQPSLQKAADKRPKLSDLGKVQENLLKRLRNPLTTAPATKDVSRPHRNLRPRRNSVDYVLNKKKPSEAPRTQSETPRLLPEAPSSQKQNCDIQNSTVVKVKVEPGLRALRPRKTDVNYQPVTKRKQSDQKQSKKCKYNPSPIEIKEQNTHTDCSVHVTQDKSKENCQNKQEKVQVEFNKVVIKVESDEIKSSNKAENKISNHKVKGDKQCLSPIRLRSQDIRLRNGKVKLSSNVKLDKLLTRTLLRDQKKIKQYCEKCNISYINKRHKCSSD